MKWLGKIPRFLGLAGFFMVELVLSSLRVARDVVTPRSQGQPAIVSVPLDLESDLEIAILVNLVSLTPGTLAMGLSSDRKTMLVHAMFAPDSDQLRREIKDGYERRIRELLS